MAGYAYINPLTGLPAPHTGGAGLLAATLAQIINIVYLCIGISYDKR